MWCADQLTFSGLMWFRMLYNLALHCISVNCPPPNHKISDQLSRKQKVVYMSRLQAETELQAQRASDYLGLRFSR